jgi:hypothetical protein
VVFVLVSQEDLLPPLIQGRDDEALEASRTP